MRYVVTGAAGALGRALLARLSPRAVVAIVRGEWVPPGIEAHAGIDIADVCWDELIRADDIVFHLAAFVHRRVNCDADVACMRHVNVDATAKLASACNKSGAKLLFASSVAVFKSPGEGLSEGAPTVPRTEYGRTKLAAEHAICGEGRKGLKYVNLRFPLMYGPAGRGNMERMLTAIARGRYWPVGNPLVRKSCLHFSDAADALIRAADANLERGAYVVAPPEPATLGELHSAAYAAVGARMPCRGIPAGPARIAARAADAGALLLGKKTRLADQIATLTTPAWYDGSRFAAVTGFVPQVDLREGLSATASWMRAQHLLP